MLNQKEKKRIATETGWSSAVINSIQTIDEYNTYKRLRLKEIMINGRPCLVPNTTPDSISLSRMRDGKAWLDSTGRAMEVHHIGGLMSSPYAVLPRDFHRGAGYFTIMHPYLGMKKSSIDRNVFRSQRKAFWMALAKLF